MTSDENTAAFRYEQLRVEINRKLFTLQSKLLNHSLDFSEQGKTSFGYVGDLSTINSSLQETLESLGWEK